MGHILSTNWSQKNWMVLFDSVEIGHESQGRSYPDLKPSWLDDAK